MVLLVQPSSAAAERALLSNSFTEQQMSSLEDYIETSIMLWYNKQNYLIFDFYWNNCRIITFFLGGGGGGGGGGGLIVE